MCCSFGADNNNTSGRDAENSDYCKLRKICLQPVSGHFWMLFTARRYASAVLAVVVCPSVRPSVRLSVCLSQAGIVSKRQHIESRKQRRTVAQGI